MVALRAPYGPDDETVVDCLPRPDPADWLTLQQAACELNISVTTARRLLRKGLLRNRIVPRRGGFAYLVYLPGSRHATLGAEACAVPVSLPEHVARRDANDLAQREERILGLEVQVESLSRALSRALTAEKSRMLSSAVGQPQLSGDDPYARYRWLARRRRWFGVPQLFYVASNASVDRLRRIVAGQH